MRQLRAVLFLSFFALVACGDNDSTGPETIDLSGTWSFSETLNAAAFQTSCNTSGQVTITQRGTTFSGNLVGATDCSGPGGTFTEQINSTITGGQVNGNNVSFQAPFCDYSGTIESSNRIAGTGSCTVLVSGQSVTFSSQWQASR